MKHQKKIIELIESNDFRQHATNKKLWYKPIEDIRYTVNMSGTIPVIAKYRGADEIFDENDKEIIALEDAIAEIISPDTPPAPEPEPQTDETKEMMVCEICNESSEKSTMGQVGYPETHNVCQNCANDIAEGKINTDHWYPEQSETQENQTKSEEPEEPEEQKEQEKPDEAEEQKESEPAKKIEEPDKTEKPITKTKMSSRICNIVPELAERGKIKIGFKGETITSQRGNEFRPPKKDDHFTITTTGKDEHGDFIIDKEIMDKIGDNCTSLDIMVLYNDPDLIFRTSYAFFNSSQCECRGDGELAITRNGETIECNPETCESFQAKACKPNGVLSVILMDAPMVGGVYKLRTSSWNTIRNITSSLDMLKSLTFGQLAGLPLALTLQPKTVKIPNKKQTTVVYVANIEFKGSMNELLNKTVQIANQNADVMHEIKRIEDNARLMLGEAPTQEECAEITAEFYPETAKKEIEG